MSILRASTCLLVICPSLLLALAHSASLFATDQVIDIQLTVAQPGYEDSLVACGPGVERIAEEVSALFPDANVALVTSDTIHSPAQAKALVETIVQRSAENQRVIFFCACGSPLKRCECHRGEVAKLLVTAASRRWK